MATLQQPPQGHLLTQLEELERRVAALEDPVSRVARHCHTSAVESAVFRWVPEDYYQRPMTERAKVLQCQVDQMCKSLVMENLACSRDDCEDANNSRYYCIVIQYASKLNLDKLKRAIQRRNPADGSNLSLNFRLASSETIALVCVFNVGSQDNERLTGFTHGAVSPFGLVSRIPVILSESVLDLRPSFFWMGGGHVHIKLGCAVQDFIKALSPIVADITDRRDEDGEGGLDE